MDRPLSFIYGVARWSRDQSGIEFYARAMGQRVRFVLTAEALAILDEAFAAECDPVSGFDAYFRNEAEAQQLASLMFSQNRVPASEFVITAAELRRGRHARNMAKSSSAHAVVAESPSTQ